MQIFHLNIRISEQEWLRYYTGQVRTVICKSTEGQTISIPAHRLRPFTTKEGIVGRFRLKLDGNRFVSLEKIQ